MSEPSSAERHAELTSLANGFVDAFNRQKIDDVMSYFAEDAVYEDASGKAHSGVAEIRAAFVPLLDGTLGKINFAGDDRFIDASQGKVMDSWHLAMRIGEEGERGMRGLDLLHFVGDKLVRKITYKQD